MPRKEDGKIVVGRSDKAAVSKLAALTDQEIVDMPDADWRLMVAKAVGIEIIREKEAAKVAAKEKTKGE